MENNIDDNAPTEIEIRAKWPFLNELHQEMLLLEELYNTVGSKSRKHLYLSVYKAVLKGYNEGLAYKKKAMENNIDGNQPIEIEIKQSSVFTLLCYDEMLLYEKWYRETQQDDVRRAYYKEEYLHAKEMYKKAVQYDRLENELTTKTLVIN